MIFSTAFSQKQTGGVFQVFQAGLTGYQGKFKVKF